MKAFSLGLFILGILLVACGIVAAILGFNLVLSSPTYAEAAIAGGLGLAIIFIRAEVMSARFTRDAAGLAESAAKSQSGVQQLQAETDRIQTANASLASSIEAIRTGLAEFQTEDKSLLAKISTLEASFTETINTRAAPLESDVDALQTKVAGFEADIDALNRGFGEIHGDFGAVHEDVGALHTNIGSLHGDFGSIHKDVGELHRDVGEIRKDVVELQESIREIKDNLQGE